MNSPSRIVKLLRSACLALAMLVWQFPPALASAPPWPQAPYSYTANNTKLDAVLADFATAFSLSLSVQPDVQGTVNGRFSAASPTDFINKLGSMYGFVWYTHAGTLFVSRASDIVTRSVIAPSGNVAEMRKALTDIGVFEPRFGWGELPDHGAAMVVGPPSYVQLLENTIRNLPARARQLMVFKLEHASAVDRTITYRDQQMVSPGLATILRNILSGGAGGLSVAPGVASPGLPGVGLGAPLASAGALGEGATRVVQTQGAGSASQAAGPSRGGAPTVQADPRTNSLIIQDVPERAALYQQLIAKLDVPTSLVEIEAMIIDVSSDKASELGVDWTGRLGRTSFSFGDTQSPTSAASIKFSSNLTAAGNFLITRLRLLQQNGDADIRSRPAVLTRENLSALLDLSQTFYIRNQGERVANVTPVTAGTTLRVTPQVVNSGGQTLVQLQIDIEDGQISVQQVDALPLVTRSTVSTEATVQDGEALLIAGYSSAHSTSDKTQLPVLGDLPGVGALFSTTTRNVQKRERIFLIRPKVVGVKGVAANMERDATSAASPFRLDMGQPAWPGVSK
jgi:type III secretion protein C